jgi:hypothetical protein
VTEQTLGAADEHVPDEPEGHAGPVTLVLPDGAERAAGAHLVSRFDPLVGRTVWSGRVDVAVPLRTELVVRTSYGESRAVTTEHDVWGNTRVRGLDRPPFPVELLDAC